MDPSAPNPLPPAPDAPKRPFDALQTLLGNDLATLLSRYGVVVVMIWQFVAGGIKDTMRDVVREELATLKGQITQLETRLAHLEKSRP